MVQETPDEELKEAIAKLIDRAKGYGYPITTIEATKEVMRLFTSYHLSHEAEVQEARLQIRLHVLSILKAEADNTFGNVKQLIYTEHDKAWQELKAHQLTPNTEKDKT